MHMQRCRREKRMENNTPIGAFESLYDLIMTIPEDSSEWSMKQWEDFGKKIKEQGKDTYNRLQSLSKEFTELREKQLELEDTIKLLHQNLDQQRAAMLDGDVKSHRKVCAEIYQAFWNDLDKNSQEFFITAHYLYDRSKAQQTDFSPVIIEFCRIFENEMLQKIFTDFIQKQASNNRLLSYSNRLFIKVENAISSHSNEGSFFLSSMDMIKLLSLMNRRFNGNCYEQALQHHIRREGFDTLKISDRQSFVNPGKKYVNEFRNEAAHPNYMKEQAATNCKEMTERLINTFLSSKN